MIVLTALLLDLLFGDPPNRFHPTAWMGSLITLWMRFRPHNHPKMELLFGGVLVMSGVALFACAGLVFSKLFELLPVPLAFLAGALLLKITFSIRSLDRAAALVQFALEKNDLPEARRLLAWHLVSRDTSQLDASHVTAATIESVAENLSDSVIAPLLFYVLGGLPLALAYRFVNTADAMLGYRDAEYEWVGKVPARLDDLLNFIPARVTGVLIVIAALMSKNRAVYAWQIMRRDAGLTASPNAGVPMSAMSGALGVILEKSGHYCLGIGQSIPRRLHLGRARIILRWVAALAAGLLIPWSLYAGK